MNSILRTGFPIFGLKKIPSVVLVLLLFLLGNKDNVEITKEDDNYLRMINREIDSRDFKILTLNEYIEVMVAEDCEILFAEKTRDLLILIFRDSKNRLVANARPRNGGNEMVTWSATSGENGKSILPSGISGFGLSAKRGPGETVKVSYIEGSVFVPHTNRIELIRLEVVVDGENKIKKTVNIEWEQDKSSSSRKDEGER